MAIHTAILRLVNVQAGKIVYKSSASIAQIAGSSTDHRVFEYQSGSAPNAASDGAKTAPTIHEYLVAEQSAGFDLVHLDQTFIITAS